MFVNVEPREPHAMRVRLKGLLTWDPSHYDLSEKNLNTGAILSVKGIPYFEIDLSKYGATSIPHARPGKDGLSCSRMRRHPGQYDISRATSETLPRPMN